MNTRQLSALFSPLFLFLSISATLAQSSTFPGLFFDDFNGPLNPIWQSNLPDAYCGSDNGTIATYVGTPGFSFSLLNSNTVIYMTNNIGPFQRCGWSSSTNFVAPNFRYEARFNSLELSSTTSIDGFIEIWIMNATNDNLYDIVSPFAGGFGGNPYMFFGSTIDNNLVQGGYGVADNTWYRLVLQCLPARTSRASLCDDNDNELTGNTFNHDGSAFGSGFKIVLSQSIGDSSMPYPDEVAVDYVSLTTQFFPIITTQPQSQTVPEGSNATFSVIAQGAFPMSCQWTYNGTNITGATNSILTITNVQPSDLGTYALIITNSYGSLVSSNAFLLPVGPALTPHFSAGTFYLGWPANPAGFVLEMTTNLNSGNWWPAPGSPLQFGDEDVQPIVPSGNNSRVFYRLKFNSQ